MALKKSLAAALITALVITGAVAVEAQAKPRWKVWNAHSRFKLPAYEPGNQYNSCFIAAPWGAQSWGLLASTFTGPLNHTLDAARFALFPNHADAYLYGKDLTGRWGSVRYIQGDVWGGSHCGTIPWRIPPSLRKKKRQLVLKVDYYRDTRNLLTR